MATLFRSLSVSCVLACLLYFFLEPVASEGLCESSNLKPITGPTPILVVDLEQPVCLGCVFALPDFSVLPFPLGTEWEVVNSGVSTPLTNNSNGVILSGINGTILLEKPSDFLTFGRSQIRCSFTDTDSMYFELSTTFQEIILNEPEIANTNADGEILGIEGQSVTLSCTTEVVANQIEEFEWFDSGGNPLSTTPGLVRPHVVVLDNVQRNQSGVYKCVVSVEGETSSANATLIVQYPGLILSGPSDNSSLTLQTGSNLTLTCTFEGLPPPNVTWTVDGNTVSDNDRQSVQTTERSTQLMFTPIISEDSGSYRCTAVNTIGISVSDAVNVIIVQVLPSAPDVTILGGEGAVVIWDTPEMPNGVIINYDLRFTSRMFSNTTSIGADKLYFVPSLMDIPQSNDGTVTVEVRGRTAKGGGAWSKPQNLSVAAIHCLQSGVLADTPTGYVATSTCVLADTPTGYVATSTLLLSVCVIGVLSSAVTAFISSFIVYLVMKKRQGTQNPMKTTPVSPPPIYDTVTENTGKENIELTSNGTYAHVQ